MRQLKISQKITDRTLTSKSFAQYLADVRTIKPFESPNEEYECAVKANNGDKDALEELVKRNLKFVISVAKQYKTKKWSLQELVNEGNYGLVEAAIKFDPSRGFKFISYAVWYIRKNIGDYLNRHGRTIRIPVNKLGTLLNINKEMARLEQELERPVTPLDLLENVDLDLHEIDALINIDTMTVSSLDAPFGDDDGNGTMLDIIENTNSDYADSNLTLSDSMLLLESVLDTLSDKQRQIINMTYGLNGEEALSLVEIGEKVAMSREGVRQQRKKAITILKINFRKRGIKMEMFNY